MKQVIYIVKSEMGYYTRTGGKPKWTKVRAEAKPFRTRRLAEGLQRLVNHHGRVPTKIERISTNETTEQ